MKPDTHFAPFIAATCQATGAQLDQVRGELHTAATHAAAGEVNAAIGALMSEVERVEAAGRMLRALLDMHRLQSRRS
jgi:hypothetical protein